MSSDIQDPLSTPEPQPVKTKADAGPVIQTLRSQLLAAKLTLTKLLTQTSPVDSPTTYQSYRWLGAAFQGCHDALRRMSMVAGFLDAETEAKDYPLEYFQISTLFADAENRLIQAMVPFNLDELPPGKINEPRFESDLKILIALNRSYEEALRHLASLANALGSETYKLGIDETERVAAWRKARRVELEKVLDDTNKELEAQQTFISKLKESKESIEKQLSENDQMTFLEIDPQQTPVVGTGDFDAGAPVKTEVATEDRCQQ